MAATVLVRVCVLASALMACGPTLKQSSRHNVIDTDRVQLGDDGRYIYMWRTERRLLSRDYERPGVLTSERETVQFSTTDELGRASFVERLSVSTEECTEVDPATDVLPSPRAQSAHRFRLVSEHYRGNHVIEERSGQIYAPSAFYVGQGEHPTFKYSVYCFEDRQGHFWTSRMPAAIGDFSLIKACPTEASAKWAPREPVTGVWKEFRSVGLRSHVAVRFRVEQHELVWQTIEFASEAELLAFRDDWEVEDGTTRIEVRSTKRRVPVGAAPSWYRGTPLIALERTLLVLPTTTRVPVPAGPIRVVATSNDGAVYLVSVDGVSYTLRVDLRGVSEDAETILEPVRLPLGSIAEEGPDHLLTYANQESGAHSSDYFWLLDLRANPTWRMVSTKSCRR
jgi:hypothetical protein